MDETDIIKFKLKVAGLTTVDREALFIGGIRKLEGISKVYAHYKKGKAEIFCRKDITI